MTASGTRIMTTPPCETVTLSVISKVNARKGTKEVSEKEWRCSDFHAVRAHPNPAGYLGAAGIRQNCPHCFDYVYFVDSTDGCEWMDSAQQRRAPWVIEVRKESRQSGVAYKRWRRYWRFPEP
jgi:hypothetical protein